MKGGPKNSAMRNEPKSRPTLSYEWDTQRGKARALHADGVVLASRYARYGVSADGRAVTQRLPGRGKDRVERISRQWNVFPSLFRSLLVRNPRWVIQRRSVAWFAGCVDALLKMQDE
jgi:hypothetical protein